MNNFRYEKRSDYSGQYSRTYWTIIHNISDKEICQCQHGYQAEFMVSWLNDCTPNELEPLLRDE